MGAGKIRNNYDKGHPSVHGQELRAKNEEFSKRGGDANELIQNSRGAEYPHQEKAHLLAASRNRKGKEWGDDRRLEYSEVHSNADRGWIAI